MTASGPLLPAAPRKHGTADHRSDPDDDPQSVVRHEALGRELGPQSLEGPYESRKGHQHTSQDAHEGHARTATLLIETAIRSGILADPGVTRPVEVVSVEMAGSGPQAVPAGPHRER